MSTDLWTELARRIAADERTYTGLAQDSWDRFDPTTGLRYRGRVEGLIMARDHMLTLAKENRDGQVNAAQDALDAACASAYLHINWKYVTKQMTTEEKEAFADACDRAAVQAAREDGEEPRLVPRWWRDDYTGPQEGL